MLSTHDRLESAIFHLRLYNAAFRNIIEIGDRPTLMPCDAISSFQYLDWV